MGNPTWPILTEGQWTLVATNVVIGDIHRLKSKYKYWATHILTGEAAPENTEAMREKSPVIFELSNEEPIESNQAIDVYIWIEDSNPDTIDTPDDAIQVSV